MNDNDIIHAINSGLYYLPERMDTMEARAMLIAIGFQESSWIHRVQVRGPARGFYQFEQIGVEGVLAHPSTSWIIRDVLNRLRITADAQPCHDAIRYNDALATVFARLLLWTLPVALPNDCDSAWDQYIASWRPGRPRREHWNANYLRALEMVQ